MAAEDIGDVTGRWDTNRGLQRWCALAIWSSLQEQNNFCILLILCSSVSLFVEEVGGDSARYWAQESGESLTEFLMPRGFGDISGVRGEDDIVKGELRDRGH